MTDYSAKHWAEKARKQASGTMVECPDGSAKHWAQVAEATASLIGNPANRDLSNLTDEGMSRLSNLPLFMSFKTGHILNNASYVNGRLFSWLSGAVYTSAYSALVNELNTQKKAFYQFWTGSDPLFTLSYAPSVGDMVYTIQNGYAFKKSKISNISYPELGSVIEITLQDGAMGQRSVGLEDVDQETYIAHSITIENITVDYFLTGTNKKICLLDQADNMTSLYAATGAADFYLLDTENQQFKLPRRNVRRLLRAYKSSTDWYNLYSDGWCEQGGSCVVPNNELITINLKQSYQDINYDIFLTQGLTNGARYQGRHAIVNSDLTTVNSFVLQNARFSGDTTSASKIYWRTSGYAATSLIGDEFEYEYFFVGNSVQNQTSVDVGQITQALTGKADVDLSNTVPGKAFTSQSAGWAMPSDEYVDLTFGASGSTYTAPANGWYYIVKATSSAGTQYFIMDNQTKGYTMNITPTSGNSVRYIFPVSKGDVILVSYTASGETSFFRFIYAQGEI